MPTTLSAMMIKTSGDAKALKPSMHSFPLSNTSSSTRDILGFVEERHPDAIGTSQERGAMLSAADAAKLCADWRRDIDGDDLIAPSSQAWQHVDEMRSLAEDGHAMLLIED